MWKSGRQQTGYKKLCLLMTSFCDVHILRYQTGDHIPPHVDTVTDKRHYRMNIELKKADAGEFKCDECIFETSRIKIFRPDISEHEVTEITGTRYVFSVGVALFG